MSFAVPEPAQRARPSTVSLAVNLLYAAAAIELINVIISLAYAGKIADGAKKALVGTSQANSNPGGILGSAVGAVIGVLIIIILVLLAVFVGRGKQVARILTWVVGGIALCCTAVAFGSTLLGSTLWDAARKNDDTLPTWDVYQDAIYSEVPSWYRPVTTILSILLLLAILAPIILLALPSSHPYFRPVKAEWEPPVPGSTDPGYPGAARGSPGAPGAPGAPGDYPPPPPPPPPSG
jgi:hypothetical protein